jgi:hypothetical protein
VSSSNFISNDIERSNSYNWLGVAYQLNGKHALAERVSTDSWGKWQRWQRLQQGQRQEWQQEQGQTDNIIRPHNSNKN